MEISFLFLYIPLSDSDFKTANFNLSKNLESYQKRTYGENLQYQLILTSIPKIMTLHGFVDPVHT